MQKYLNYNAPTFSINIAQFVWRIKLSKHNPLKLSIIVKPLNGSVQQEYSKEKEEEEEKKK